MIQIEKITKIGNRFEAIANDGKDYGKEISATILLRAAEGWNNKTKLYFNTETNKWTRVAEFPEPKVAKAPKAPKAVKAKNPAKGAALKAAAKKASAELDGQDFMDEKGTILDSFVEKLKAKLAAFIDDGDDL